MKEALKIIGEQMLALTLIIAGLFACASCGKEIQENYFAFEDKIPAPFFNPKLPDAPIATETTIENAQNVEVNLILQVPRHEDCPVYCDHQKLHTSFCIKRKHPAQGHFGKTLPWDCYCRH